MDLHVEIMGLCLFVPRGDAVHVLMPRTGQLTGGYQVPPHSVSLNYAGTSKPVDMPGWYLDLSAARGTGTPASIPTALVETGRLSGNRRVDARQWSDRPRRTVVSRVTLPLATEIACERIVEWEVDLLNGIKEAAFLTHHLTWKVKDAAVEKIVWERKRLDDATPQCVTIDRPTPTGNRIVLSLTHVPGKEYPPYKGEESLHYQAYRDVFADRGHHHRVVLNQDPDLALLAEGASAFTCMLAQAPPE